MQPLSQNRARPISLAANCATIVLFGLFGLCSAPALAQTQPVCSLATQSHKNVSFRVPFKVVDGRIYVKARVNGRGPFEFAVDTGASGIARADTRLVAKLDLPVSGRTTTTDGVATSEVKTTILKSVQIGRFKRRNASVITRDYSKLMSPDAPFDGIIGREFFDGGLLIIDYPAKVLSFAIGEQIPAHSPQAIPYDRPFRVPVQIGSLETEANLDTGANVSFIFPKSLIERIRTGPLQDAGNATMTNIKIRTEKAIVHDTIQIGTVRFSDVEVRVSERFPELLVGSHVLQNFIVMIDQPSKQIALCKAPAAPMRGLN